MLLGVELNISEENMTIIFSVVLGVFAVASVVLMFHKCKQKMQYLHQPLNTDDTGKKFLLYHTFNTNYFVDFQLLKMAI